MSSTRQNRKRLTKAQKAERADFAQKEERIKERLKNQLDRATALRSKDREFHGLEREFRDLQEQMLAEYKRSKDVKHPRDVGNTREVILRDFLTRSGLLPRRYAVSTNSVRVSSTTGHTSNELDLLFYDPLDSVSLMRRQGVYDVLPIESTYGTIQVKSKVNRKDIKDGLSNIASFKKLARVDSPLGGISFGKPKSRNGFGLLFAFDTDLDWLDIIDEVKTFAENNPRHLWSNAVFILSKGAVFYGDKNTVAISNEQLNAINDLQMHGRPDREGMGLYGFYTVLLELLVNTEIQAPPITNYFRLPLVAGEYSYEFNFGSFAEYGICEQHGDYAKKMTSEKLVEVIDWCKTSEPIHWIRATDIAYGKSGDDVESYARQPGEVRIYNPEGLSLPTILVGEKPMMIQGEERMVTVLAYDWIISAGMNIWIPYYYEIKDKIINLCPKCEKEGRYDFPS